MKFFLAVGECPEAVDWQTLKFNKGKGENQDTVYLRCALGELVPVEEIQETFRASGILRVLGQQGEGCCAKREVSF